MDDHRFDAMVRSVAAARSRRGLLKTFMAGLAGVAAVSVSRGGSVSASNSDCAHFCNAVYSGSARGKCKSDAAKHVPGNLCEACGADVSRVCSGPGGAMTCCADGETCNSSSGVCETPEVCSYESCQAEPDANPLATCCGSECGLLLSAPCDPSPGLDRCCGAVNGDPDGSHCVYSPDTPPFVSEYRCCLPNGDAPCSTPGQGFCQPGTDCSICCSGYCGTEVFDEFGQTACAPRPA
jgi:hypothetical protein